MKIIGLLGAAGAGKTTVSRYLVEKYNAKLLSFANPLKEIIRLAFDLTDAQVYGTQQAKEAVDERYNVSPRWLMQRIGTEGVRAVLGEDYWWEYCMGRIFEDTQTELFVIDDFRFVNEVEGFLSLNDSALAEGPEHKIVNIWRIENPINLSDADPNHASEAEWTRCRYTNLIKPPRAGLVELYDEIDRVAFDSGVFNRGLPQ